MNVIYFNDWSLDSFISDWAKMYRLRSTGTIDEDVFNLWVEKTVNNLDNKRADSKNYYYDESTNPY